MIAVSRVARETDKGKNMDMDSYKTWAIFGGAGGAGFGLLIAPLIYILVNLFFGGVGFGSTFGFALANAVTWGVLGMIGGVFIWGINELRAGPEAD